MTNWTGALAIPLILSHDVLMPSLAALKAATDLSRNVLNAPTTLSRKSRALPTTQSRAVPMMPLIRSRMEVTTLTTEFFIDVTLSTTSFFIPVTLPTTQSHMFWNSLAAVLPMPVNQPMIPLTRSGMMEWPIRTSYRYLKMSTMVSMMAPMTSPMAENVPVR